MQTVRVVVNKAVKIPLTLEYEVWLYWTCEWKNGMYSASLKLFTM